MFKKKHWPRCFWRCLKKNQNIMLTMHINDVFQTIKKRPKIFIHFFKYEWQSWHSKFEKYIWGMGKAIQGYIFGWITRLLPWLFIEFPKPKTSWKTSCFFLNDAMFWRCFWKNIDVDVFDDVLQNSKHRANDASNDVNRPPLRSRLQVVAVGIDVDTITFCLVLVFVKILGFLLHL